MSERPNIVGPDGDFLVMNPEAVGDPDANPVVYVGPDLMRLLNPCRAAAPSREDGTCGGVNGFHATDCERAQ